MQPNGRELMREVPRKYNKGRSIILTLPPPLQRWSLCSGPSVHAAPSKRGRLRTRGHTSKPRTPRREWRTGGTHPSDRTLHDRDDRHDHGGEAARPVADAEDEPGCWKARMIWIHAAGWAKGSARQNLGNDKRKYDPAHRSVRVLHTTFDIRDLLLRESYASDGQHHCQEHEKTVYQKSNGHTEDLHLLEPFHTSAKRLDKHGTWRQPTPSCSSPPCQRSKGTLLPW